MKWRSWLRTGRVPETSDSESKILTPRMFEIHALPILGQLRDLHLRSVLRSKVIAVIGGLFGDTAFLVPQRKMEVLFPQSILRTHAYSTDVDVWVPTHLIKRNRPVAHRSGRREIVYAGTDEARLAMFLRPVPLDVKRPDVAKTLDARGLAGKVVWMGNG
jgi:hypothetical protein